MTVSAKPMNFENASFIGRENQFIVFSWLYHDVGFYSVPLKRMATVRDS